MNNFVIGRWRERLTKKALRMKLPFDRFDSITYVGDAVWGLEAAQTCNYSFIGVGVGDAAGQLRHAGAGALTPSFALGDRFRELIERKLHS